MTSPLRERDLELLSAYLDNQLSTAEKAQLERRLAVEPELREALGGLRATARAVRSLTALRVPRNFTLDARVYGRRPSTASRSYPLLQWATALATFLFVVVVAGDFISRSSAFRLAAPQPAAALQTEAAALKSATAEVEAPSAAPAEAPAAEASAESAVSPTELPPAATALPTFAPAAPVGGGVEATPAAAQAFAAPTQAEEAATPRAAADQAGGQPTATPLATATAGTESSEPVTREIAPTATPAAVAAGNVAQATTAAIVSAPGAPAPPVNWLRVAEIGLAVLALGLGLATFWLRRRAR